METIYYDLNARRIKVSGGADLVTFVPTPAAKPTGEVLDFDRCRRRLETKAAWKELEKTAEEAGEPAAPAPEGTERRERAADWLELAASAAVIGASVAAAVSFLGLL